MMTLLFLALVFIVGFLAGGIYSYKQAYLEAYERICNLIEKVERKKK